MLSYNMACMVTVGLRMVRCNVLSFGVVLMMIVAVI